MKKKNKTIVWASALSIMMMFVISGVSSMDTSPKNMAMRDDTPASFDDYTHTVMVEACTASWCSPCATAAAVMNDIYNQGEYDFKYVALVSDKNTYANQRCGELSVQYIPDYVFDGGYTRYVGSSGLPNAYTSRLDQSGAREVDDIDIDLDIAWKGDGEIDIDVIVTNNEASAYSGHIHVYVTEIVSRWNTYNGLPYHYAMVGNYAFNQNMDISAGDSSDLSTTWDGSQYGVGDIERNNVAVIATIFNRDNNMYSDETAGVSFGDLPPDVDIEVSSIIGGITADITNNGDFDITDLEWGISAVGGILKMVNVTTLGTIDTLPIGEKTTVQTNATIFGLGKINIVVMVNVLEEVRQGFVLGPFIILT